MSPPSLRKIARALGGEVYGRKLLCAGPGHSCHDRSLQITADANAPDGFYVHSYACDDWQMCRDYVRRRLGLAPFKPGEMPPQRPLAPRRRAAPDEAKRNAQKAAWLWRCRQPVSESNAAGRYLRKRAYGGAFPLTLGFIPGNDKHPLAMIAAFGFCGESEPGLIMPPASVRGVHLTRLEANGDKAAVAPVKIMLGPMSGLPIVLAPVNDGLGLAITEGIEDGLSVFEETGLGVWAAGSAGNMPKIAAALPAYVECVTIFAHRDEAGLHFAKEAADIIRATGTEVHLKGLG
jgi:Toprim domain